jgi:hypothetical protein
MGSTRAEAHVIYVTSKWLRHVNRLSEAGPQRLWTCVEALYMDLINSFHSVKYDKYLARVGSGNEE